MEPQQPEIPKDIEASKTKQDFYVVMAISIIVVVVVIGVLVVTYLSQK